MLYRLVHVLCDLFFCQLPFYLLTSFVDLVTALYWMAFLLLFVLLRFTFPLLALPFAPANCVDLLRQTKATKDESSNFSSSSLLGRKFSSNLEFLSLCASWLICILGAGGGGGVRKVFFVCSVLFSFVGNVWQWGFWKKTHHFLLDIW